jgi:hypothetical protein
LNSPQTWFQATISIHKQWSWHNTQQQASFKFLLKLSLNQSLPNHNQTHLQPSNLSPMPTTLNYQNTPTPHNTIIPTHHILTATEAALELPKWSSLQPLESPLQKL